MRPKLKDIKLMERDMFRSDLSEIIDTEHKLVKLAGVINWEVLEELFGKPYSFDTGRPGISTRLMVSLHYLKYAYNLSDVSVLEGWIENPYWQYFSGERRFQHTLPIDSSSMTRWRKRIGEAGAERLLQETIKAGFKIKAVKKSELKRLNVDTTVQEKSIRYPTDAGLYNRCRERLVEFAKARGIKLRQNYNRIAKRLNYKQSRYIHARQMKRAGKCIKKLKTILGRVTRDIERKALSIDDKLKELLEISKRIYTMKRKDKNKIYSVHEPYVECISKGKAHKKYEFGCKVSVAATSRGGWFVGVKALHGNPYDGHTLSQTIKQVKHIAIEPEHIFVDRGYQGHNYKGKATVHIDKTRRGKTSKSLWKWIKRRAAIEPSIGHLKQEHRLDKNRLKGILGDKINAILSAVGMNFKKLLNWLAYFLRLFLKFKSNNSKNLTLSLLTLYL